MKPSHAPLRTRFTVPSSRKTALDLHRYIFPKLAWRNPLFVPRATIGHRIIAHENLAHTHRPERSNDMATILVLALAAIGGLLVDALLFWGVARLFAVERASLPRALLAVLLLTLVQTGLMVGFQALATPATMPAALLLLCVQVVLAWLTTWAVIVLVFRTRAVKGALVALTTQVAAAGLAVGMYFGLQQLVHAYVVPTNAMAPTLIGYHARLACPHCQGPAVVSAAWAMEGMPPPEGPQKGMCTQCLRIADYENVPKTVQAPDRFICSTFLEARRWDVVVFRYPRDPAIRYVTRLVGLPGEMVAIKDNAVWINGTRAPPPADIAALTYLPHPDPLGAPDGGPAEWALGPDDYFVLGDFTTNSSDSRDWGPVPRANLEAVATLIYWPPSRWRILR
jgi:signal peptidase I